MDKLSSQDEKKKHENSWLVNHVNYNLVTSFSYVETMNNHDY